ncbi:MAG TPA: methyltransferase domain-containing protein [Gemmataceae bacterium]|nr:methyltransferase domain-containing protein [Gemmataceae bacterium]
MGKLTSLTHRHLQPEIMDRADLDPDRHRHALWGLERINWLSGSAGILWPSIRGVAEETNGEPLRVLDVACGAGDLSIALCRRAARAGLNVQLEAADISSRALEHAQKRAEAARTQVHFLQRDALTGDFPSNYDVMFSSLFLHHLNEEQAVSLLQRMARAARRMVLVSDLARSRLGWTAAYLVTRLLTTSDVVHTDGPLSVEGAFTPTEALKLAHRAGLHGATVVGRWPFRYLLTWRPE